MKTVTLEKRKLARTGPRKKYQGLCSTCKRAPGCVFPRDPHRPVMQCDEFEGLEKLVVEKPEVRKQSEPVAEKARSDAASEFKGLCRLCEIRATCTYPKPKGGVWHCEEYE